MQAHTARQLIDTCLLCAKALARWYRASRGISATGVLLVSVRDIYDVIIGRQCLRDMRKACSEISRQRSGKYYSHLIT